MKIQKLTLDKKDIVEAVQMFLKTRSITLPVANVTQSYRREDWEVEFQFDVEPAMPACAPTDAPEIEMHANEKDGQ